MFWRLNCCTYEPSRRIVRRCPAPMLGRKATSMSQPCTFTLKRFDVVWITLTIGPSPEGFPSGAPRMMKLANWVSFAAEARIVAELRPPITIESFSRIEYQSQPIESSRIGSNTIPNVPDFDFSGSRLGLPPVSVGNWLPQSVGEPVARFGQRRKSRELLAVTLEACGV